MLPTQRDEDAVQVPDGSGQRFPGPATGRVSWTETMDGFRRMLPVTLYVVPMGLAFGAAALQQDLPGPLAILMSAVVFAGSAQFAALDLWSATPALVPRLLTTFAVNARHVLLGASLAPWLNKLPPSRRYGTVTLLSDANWALVTQIQERPAAAPTRAASRTCSSAPALSCGRHGCWARPSAWCSAATLATSPSSGSIFSSSPSSPPCSPASGAA
jgi:hypothetical protein